MNPYECFCLNFWLNINTSKYVPRFNYITFLYSINNAYVRVAELSITWVDTKNMGIKLNNYAISRMSFKNSHQKKQNFRV